MRLVRITKIKDHRVFRDFTWPTDLQPFARFNLVYGWNGSGKTTLSNVLRHIETKSAVAEGTIEIEFDTGTVAGGEFGTVPVPDIRVFNRDVVASSIFAAGQEIDPIFYFGEESVEKQKQVDRLKKDLDRAQNELSKKRAARNEAERARDKICEDGAKLIREALRTAGSSKYNSYDKRSFKHTMDGLTRAAAQAATLSDGEKLQLQQQITERPRPSLDQIKPFTSDRNRTRECAENLALEVTSNVIEKLMTDVETAAWVQQGLHLHTGSRATKTCSFCDQAIRGERISALQEHFSDAFAQFQRDSLQLISTIEGERSGLVGFECPDGALLYDHLRNDYVAAVNRAKAIAAERAAYLDKLIAALRAKQSSPFLQLMLDEYLDGATEPNVATLNTEISMANAVIDTHNLMTADFKQNVEEARSALERAWVSEKFEDYRVARSAFDAAEKDLQSAQAKPAAMREEIAKLERDIVEHRRPAEELNAELRSYLGRDELRFDVKENGYTLTRNGIGATNLSEGEKTAIAFLYFLKSLGDKSFERSRGVVVIDDPVSSLDSNALFSAFAYMRERTKGVGQLIILTHNFTFFRQARQWLRNMPGQRKKDAAARPACFYMLVAQGDGPKRAARLAPLDRLLSEFDSEYHFLFHTIVRESESTQNTPLENRYAIPNMARKLLETFFAFRFPDTAGDLTKKIERVDFDDGRKMRVLRFLHTYSHSGAITDSEHDPSELAELRSVLCDLLDMMRACDLGHCEGMVKALAKAGGEDDD